MVSGRHLIERKEWRSIKSGDGVLVRRSLVLRSGHGSGRKHSAYLLW